MIQKWVEKVRPNRVFFPRDFMENLPIAVYVKLSTECAMYE
jgi:hypothetical protein